MKSKIQPPGAWGHNATPGSTMHVKVDGEGKYRILRVSGVEGKFNHLFNGDEIELPCYSGLDMETVRAFQKAIQIENVIQEQEASNGKSKPNVF